MPNWCTNNATFEHDDPAMIKRMVDGFSEGRLFQEFVPCPQELLEGVSPAPEDKAEANMKKHGFADWYTWCLANWGTKWDISNDGFDPSIGDGDRSVFLSFDTAWGPPVQFYQRLEEDLGFRVNATYFEPGMAFVGEWSDGEDFEYKIDMDDLDGIPEHLAEEYDILSWYDHDEETDNGEEE